MTVMKIGRCCCLALLSLAGGATGVPAILKIRRGGGGGNLSPPTSSTWSKVPATPAPRAPGWTTSSSQQSWNQAQRHEASKEAINSFLTRDSRNKFISRVYSIVSVQLLVTVLSVALFAVAPANLWRRSSLWAGAIPLLSFACSSVAWMFMYSSTTARRSSPLKWQLLSAFTLGEAVTVGFLSRFYTPRSVAASLIATTVAAGGVSIFTIMNRNSKRDLSQWGMTLSSIGLAFVAYGFMTLLMYAGILPPGFLPYRESVYGMIGAALFSFYLAYHTRMIVTGKHTQHQMNEKDYVFGAMTLYNDIINMFIYILKILGDDRGDDREH